MALQSNITWAVGSKEMCCLRTEKEALLYIMYVFSCLNYKLQTKTDQKHIWKPEYHKTPDIFLILTLVELIWSVS